MDTDKQLREHARKVYLGGVHAVNSVLAENRRLRERVKFANELIKRGVELMECEQVSEWESVRTYLETIEDFEEPRDGE